MGLDLFAAVDAMEIGIGLRPRIRRTPPRNVLKGLRDAARAGLATMVVPEQRLDLLDAASAAPSRTDATWDR